MPGEYELGLELPSAEVTVIDPASDLRPINQNIEIE